MQVGSVLAVDAIIGDNRGHVCRWKTDCSDLARRHMDGIDAPGTASHSCRVREHAVSIEIRTFETRTIWHLNFPPSLCERCAVCISAQTLEFHHGEHHQAYVTLVKNESLENISSRRPPKDDAKVGVQQCRANLEPYVLLHEGGGAPTVDVAKLIDDAFGGFDKFKEEFKNARDAIGSGWAWLIVDGKLKITNANAVDPLAQGLHRA